MAIWIALEDLTPEMGPLLYASGSHNSQGGHPVDTLSVRDVPAAERVAAMRHMLPLTDERVEARYRVKYPVAMVYVTHVCVACQAPRRASIARVACLFAPCVAARHDEQCG